MLTIEPSDLGEFYVRLDGKWLDTFRSRREAECFVLGFGRAADRFGKVVQTLKGQMTL